MPKFSNHDKTDDRALTIAQSFLRKQHSKKLQCYTKVQSLFAKKKNKQEGPEVANTSRLHCDSKI